MNEPARISKSEPVSAIMNGKKFFDDLRSALVDPVPEVVEPDDWRGNMVRQQKANRIASIEAHWHAPQRQMRLATPDRSGPWGQMEASLRSKLGTGFLIGLIGSRGCGKTQLGIELMRHTARERMLQPLYCSAVEFFVALKSTYRKDSEKTEEDVLNEYRSPALLVMDEAGRRGETEWEDRLLFELLDKRYEDMTDTLLISNQSREEFSRAIGASLSSRMVETGGLIECNWESFRK